MDYSFKCVIYRTTTYVRKLGLLLNNIVVMMTMVMMRMMKDVKPKPDSVDEYLSAAITFFRPFKWELLQFISKRK